MENPSKWIIFISAIIIGIPCMVYFLRQSERNVNIFITLFFIIALNDLGGKFAINIISFEKYRGWSRGMEITALDLMCIAFMILLSTQPSTSFRHRLLRPESWGFILYCAAAFLSIFTAFVPLYAFFGWWKIFRGIIVFFLFSRLIDRESRLKHLVTTFGLMCLYELPLVLVQKYAWHIYRATGTLPHMNTLAMSMNLLSLPVFAAFLMDTGKPKKWYILVIAAAIFNVICTLSRGALVSWVIGMVVCLLFLRRRHLVAERVTLLTIMGLTAFFVALKVLPTLQQRFLEAPPESEQTRKDFNECCKDMIRERFFGVGINNFSYAIGHTHLGEKAPLNEERIDRDDGVAHHIYYLTGAEMGWPGLLAFFFMIGGILFRCLWLIRKVKNNSITVYAIGLFAGMITLHIQGLLEWVFLQTNIWFIFCALSGTIAALGRLGLELPAQEPALQIEPTIS